MNGYFDDSLIDDLEKLAEEADRIGDYRAANDALMRIEEISNQARQKAFTGGQLNLDVPSPEQEAVVSQYYQQQAQQRAAQPQPSIADRAVGAGEAGLSMLTGATGGTLGMLAGGVGGVARNVLAGTYGTPEGADVAEQYATDAARSLTYEPKTALGGEYLQNIGEATAPLAGLAGVAPLAEAAMVGRLASPAMRDIPQTPGAQEQAQRIAAGETSRDLARSTLAPGSAESGAPRLARDPAAREAIKQGFDEGVIQAVKQTTPQNKAKLLRMANIAERGADDEVFRSLNRPADVVGDSLSQRIKFIRNVNKDAGQRLDGVAKSLRGQQGNIEGPANNFAANLNEMGITQDDNGRLAFIGSDIEGITGAEKILSQVAQRVNRLDANDAYDMHRLKRYIDEQVTYGKTTEGLSGKAERTLKQLRADIDASLDAQFPEYNRVNTQYSDTIQALDAFQDAAGTKVDLFGPNSEKALGTVSRRLLSNTQSRANLLTSLKDIEDVSKKYGTTFDDDIITQVMFADALDKRFGAAAATSLQGDVGKGVKRGLETATGQRTLTGMAIDAAGNLAERARGINDKNAFKSIKKLLERDAAK